MHQVTMQAIALQNTRQHQAQTAAERARLLDVRHRPLPAAACGACCRRSPAGRHGPPPDPAGSGQQVVGRGREDLSVRVHVGLGGGR